MQLFPFIYELYLNHISEFHISNSVRQIKNRKFIIFIVHLNINNKLNNLNKIKSNIKYFLKIEKYLLIIDILKKDPKKKA